VTTLGQPLVLLAPLAGWSAPIDETPDPVFAEKMLGDGIAIDPTLGELRAPCDGEVIAVHEARHAVTIRAEAGAEVLLHVGLDTVALGGEGFSVCVAVGQAVAAGDLLLRFDLDLIVRRARSLVSPVVVTNGESFVIERVVTGREVALGEPVLTLRAVSSAGPEAEARDGPELRRRARVALPHGLHARPAALLAREAAKFPCAIEVEAGERIANARSPVAVMALGVRSGDEIGLCARGPEAAAALEALSAVVSDAGVAADFAEPPPPLAPATPPAAPDASPLATLGGVPAAPGLAIGAAVRLVEPEVVVDERAGAPDEERGRLSDALAAVKTKLLQRLNAERGQGREILEAHLAFLDDSGLADAAEAAIRNGGSAGVAWRDAIGGYVARLESLSDARISERAADLVDLERQVLVELSGEITTEIMLPDSAVVLADDLLPSQLMALDATRLAGLATSRGGPTSHVAILAAAMNIPAVVALGPRLMAIEDGALVILDGEAGRLRVAPGPSEIEAAQTRLSRRLESRAEARAAAAEPCRTADGTRIEVFANLGRPEEASIAALNGAEGCGLLRTEFLFLDRDAAPSEDEQLAAYQAIADTLEGRPLVIRTLDVGADKPVAYLPMPPQENPALGIRGLRVGFAWPSLLRTQLRAILRVRPAGQARIMLPMVASLAELTAARRIIAEVASELGAAVPQVGVMVETPAAAVTADLLAADAEFLSLGTNDLAQYALAMDRTAAELAAQVDALHPAVLRLIRQTALGAAPHRRLVAVCGAIAGDLAAAPILIGLGVTELSAPPGAIPELKAAIRRLTLSQCRDIAERALAQASTADVRALALSP
jgi:phosphocarrier protein FPr/phosphocarrier protein